MASELGQPAHVLEGARVGLFSQVLRRGIAGNADSNEDERVSLAELTPYLQAEVLSRAGLEGYSQSPTVSGNGSNLCWPR